MESSNLDCPYSIYSPPPKFLISQSSILHHPTSSPFTLLQFFNKIFLLYPQSNVQDFCLKMSSKYQDFQKNADVTNERPLNSSWVPAGWLFQENKRDGELRLNRRNLGKDDGVWRIENSKLWMENWGLRMEIKIWQFHPVIPTFDTHISSHP